MSVGSVGTEATSVFNANVQMSGEDRSSWDHCWVTVIGSPSETNMLQITLVCEGAYKVFTHSDAV